MGGEPKFTYRCSGHMRASLVVESVHLPFGAIDKGESIGHAEASGIRSDRITYIGDSK